jgi:hypothetical protein
VDDRGLYTCSCTVCERRIIRGAGVIEQRVFSLAEPCS